ncbi:MAG: 50S ribosomal protein L30 [Chloroflexota bacterium]
MRSTIGRPQDQEATVRTMGLRRLHQTVELPDTPAVRGMIKKVRHLVEVEDGNDDNGESVGGVVAP